MESHLQSPFQKLHREMLEELERTAAAENHWLVYALLGWEHLIACCVSHYLLQVKRIQEPRGLYLLIWLAQILVVSITVRFICGQPSTPESPLEPLNKRIWTIFLFLCFNVAVLNVLSGQPIFVFMPALATLSSFAFAVMTTFISRRFSAAGLAMFVTGILMAKFREYEFLIYGAGWLAVLESLSVILWQKRRRWIAAASPSLACGDSSPLFFPKRSTETITRFG